MTRPASAPEAVERGLTVLVLIWQLAWTALDPSLWPQRQSQPLVAVCLALPWLTWLAAVLTTFGPEAWRRWNRPALVADVLVLCVASITIVAVSGPDATGGRPVYFSLVLLAVALSGLVLQWRAALAVVVTMAVTETALLSWQAAVGDPITLSDALLNGLQTLYTGVANTGVSAGLRRAAARTGEAHDALLAATRAEQVADAVERDVTAHERVLHDTVLNTLTAVARGGLEGRDADVRAACRTAADEVRALARPDLVATIDDDDADTGDLADLLFAPVTSLRAAGVDVTTAAGSTRPCRGRCGTRCWRPPPRRCATSSGTLPHNGSSSTWSPRPPRCGCGCATTASASTRRRRRRGSG